MLPAASPIGAATPTATAQSSARSTQPQAPETARASAGEASAANVRTETPNAVRAPEQSAVAPRLRDQETAERTERQDPPKDQWTGPEPAFEETPLERQARVIFDPPETGEVQDPIPTEATSDTQADTTEPTGEVITVEAPAADPPPTPTERAETSFSETRALAEHKTPSTVDVAS